LYNEWFSVARPLHTQVYCTQYKAIEKNKERDCSEVYTEYRFVGRIAD